MATQIAANLWGLIQAASSAYISDNAETFRSLEPGTVGATGPQGDKGDQGSAGNDGTNGTDLTVEQVIDNGDYTFTFDFSDGTNYTTPVLRGEQGVTGETGLQGLQGVSVHHTKGTSTTDQEGDFGEAGQTDTYTLYGDAGETLNLGSFVVKNGLAGNMAVTVYDINESGVVDDSEALGGKSLATIEAERDAAIAAATLALGANFNVADHTEKDALTGLDISDKIFVIDDGDGKWAHYIVTAITDGLGSTSTFEVIMDEDTYLNANTAASIKTTYESNADTNAYTDAEKTQVSLTETTTELNTRDTNNRNRTNHTGTQVASTISDFNNTVGAQTTLTGVLTHEDTVAINVDTTKIDIITFDYWILGMKYNYAGSTAITPTIASGDSSTFVGVDASGIVYSDAKFTDVQTQTILPLARLQAFQGESGPGSNLQSPVPLEYTIGEEGYHDRDFQEHAIGHLYVTGGTFSESATPLQVDQTSGSFHNNQKKHIEITGSSNITASSLYNISSVPTLQNEATLVVPKFYDNGTDIVALSNNKYVSHTLLRSPKAEDNFILVYGNASYDSLASAEAAPIDFSIFQSQAISGFMAVARFIVKGDSTNIILVKDERPKIGGTQSAIIGTATLQQVFDNSSNPEVITDDVRGAMTIRRGSALDTDVVLECQNGAGTNVFTVTGEGDIALSGALDGEVTVTPQGNLSSTTVQLALEELQTDIDTINQVNEW